MGNAEPVAMHMMQKFVITRLEESTLLAWLDETTHVVKSSRYLKNKKNIHAADNLLSLSGEIICVFSLLTFWHWKKNPLSFFYTGTLAIVLLCHICMLKASSVICKVTPSLYCLKNYTHYFQFSMFFLRIKEVQTINHSKSGPSNKNVMCWCVSIITVCFQFQNKSETHNIFV